MLNKAGYEVAPDLFLEEFAKREAVDQASGEDDAASLRAAVESRDLHDGFLLYGYIYDADELRALAEDTLDVEKIELVTDGERCPVYYIEVRKKGFPPRGKLSPQATDEGRVKGASLALVMAEGRPSSGASRHLPPRGKAF